MQRIDYYETTNERYHWSGMGSKFPKLTKPHWLIDDLTAYPKPNDQYIPNDQMCKKIDPNIL